MKKKTKHPVLRIRRKMSRSTGTVVHIDKKKEASKKFCRDKSNKLEDAD